MRVSLKLNSPLTGQELRWQEADAEKSIKEQGGSKAGSIAYLHRTQNHLRPQLPPNSFYLAPDDDIEKFLDQTDFSKPKVVRGCHPLDFNGMVDVIDSKINLRSREEVRRAIEEIRRSAESEEVKSYMKYETGEDFDGKVGILVQDFCGYRRGSIIEHPHEKGIYRVITLDDRDKGEFKPLSDQFFDRNGRQINQSKFRGTNGIGEIPEKMYFDASKKDIFHDLLYGLPDINGIPAVVKLYRSIRDSGLIPEDHSFQMEFGINAQNLDQPIFYQARIFRPFEERGNFDIPNVSSDFGSGFGITPEDGIEVYLKYLNPQNIESPPRNNLPQAYWYNSFGNRSSTGIDLKPKDMSAYVISDRQRDILEHGHYRWLTKAPIASASSLDYNEIKRHLYNPVKARIFSNGIHSKINLED